MRIFFLILLCLIMLLNCYLKNHYHGQSNRSISVVNARAEMRKRDSFRCVDPQGKPGKVISRWSPKKREKERERDNDCLDQKKCTRERVRLRVLPKRILLRDSARSLFRHVRATTFTDDDDDEDDEDYPLFHGRTSPRTSLFQECELLWKRSYKEIAVSLPITRKVARNLMLLILGETLLILEESLLIRQESNIIKKNERAESNEKL